MYNQFIQNLLTQRVSLLEQIHHIDAMLKLNGVEISDGEYLTTDTDQSLKSCPYKKGDTYQRKFGALLTQMNRFVTINELANMLITYEPKTNIDEAKKGLQSAKNLLLKANAIKKFQVGSNNSNTFYGAPSWLDAEGKPMLDHMYDEAVLQLKPQILIG